MEEQVVAAPNRQHSTVCIRESKGLASTRTKVDTVKTGVLALTQEL